MKIVNISLLTTFLMFSALAYGIETNTISKEKTKSAESKNILKEGSLAFEASASFYSGKYTDKERSSESLGKGKFHRYEVKIGKMFSPTPLVSLTPKLKYGMAYQTQREAENGKYEFKYGSSQMMDLGLEQSILLNIPLTETLIFRPFLMCSLAVGLLWEDAKIFSTRVETKASYNRIEGGIGTELLFRQKFAPYISFNLTRESFGKYTTEETSSSGAVEKNSADANINLTSKRLTFGLSIYF
jgi:hypothetical protein